MISVRQHLSSGFTQTFAFLKLKNNTLGKYYLPHTSQCIHTTSMVQFPGQNWRKKKGLPSNPNMYGPLTDGPDYSFLDGRPTPPGIKKVERALRHQEIAEKVMELNAEIDFAVANHKSRVQKSDEMKSQIISKKLKKKGNLPPETFT